DAGAHIHLGLVLRALKRDADALASFDKALVLDPANVDALGNRGDVLLSLRRPAEALDCFERILAAAPGHLEARANRGAALATLRARWGGALAARPGGPPGAPRPPPPYRRGRARAARAPPAGPLGAYARSLAMMPTHVPAMSSRGVALQALNRHAEAIASFDRALALAPDFADAHFNRSLALLATGDYARGQMDYEWRWKRSGAAARPNCNRPLWLGETPLGSRTILLHAEQGLGDTIMFARYVGLLARAGAKVMLEVHPELKALMSRLPGCAAVIGRGEPRPAHD